MVRSPEPHSPRTNGRLEILQAPFLEEQPRLAMGHMEVRIDFEARDASDQLTHLYNFRNGRSTQSFGTV